NSPFALAAPPGFPFGPVRAVPSPPGTRSSSGDACAAAKREAGNAMARNWCGRSVLYSSRQASRAAPASGAETRWGHRWTYQLTPDGPDATIVTEIYDCSRAPEDERLGMDNGNVWVESMANTLERLDALCARQAG
ncbi:MAG: hypothetical protein ACR2MP_17080, partial [Streptosporangiaceae bacterium]